MIHNFAKVLLLLFLLIHKQTWAAQDEVAIPLAVSGKVTVLNPSGERRELKRRDPLFKGDTIDVGEKSRVQLRFSDGTLLSLCEKTIFKIDDYQYLKSNEDVFSASLRQGCFRAHPGAIDSKDTKGLTISTPVAVMGVVGTDIAANVADNETAVALFTGSGWIRNTLGTLSLGEQSNFDFATLSDAGKAPVGQLFQPEALATMERIFLRLDSTTQAALENSILREFSARPITRRELANISEKLSKLGTFADKPMIRLLDRQIEFQAESLHCQ